MVCTSAGAVSLDDLVDHRQIDFKVVQDADAFSPFSGPGGTKYEMDLGRNARLRALLVNRSCDVLLVSLHGATARRKFELPRFEWFRTLQATGYSALYFSDPCLDLDERLELAWYTGWYELDLYPVLAEWAMKAAEAVGAEYIVFFGSSGGGLAALQTSTYVPGSIALPFNPQTSIANYKVRGTDLGAQRSYVRSVMPHLTPDGGVSDMTPNVDWSASLGERTSALVRYSRSQPNKVLYAQNNNDVSHVEQHYAPFREVVENGVNHHRVRFLNYDGAARHDPPRPAEFKNALGQALDWVRSP